MPVTVIRLVNMRKRLRLKVINPNPKTFIVYHIHGKRKVEGLGNDHRKKTLCWAIISETQTVRYLSSEIMRFPSNKRFVFFWCGKDTSAIISRQAR